LSRKKLIRPNRKGETERDLFTFSAVV